MPVPISIWFFIINDKHFQIGLAVRADSQGVDDCLSHNQEARLLESLGAVLILNCKTSRNNENALFLNSLSSV